MWGWTLLECYVTLKEVFAGAHERFPEGPKVCNISKFLGENVGAVDFSGNVLYLE